MKMKRFILVMTVLVGSLYAGKSIVVDLSTQTATAYESDVPVFSGQISTGTAKRPTPTGHFRVLEKDIDHVSTSWPKPNGGAKMHYMLRLTQYGIAMHLGYVPSYPASHGCIRLQNGFAQRMYRWAHVGIPVRVVGHAPRHVVRPTANKYRVAKRTPKRVMHKRESIKMAHVYPVSTVPTIQRPIALGVQRKSRSLDILSTSPKAAIRARKVQNTRVAAKYQRKTPRVNPLKVISTAPVHPARASRSTQVIKQSTAIQQTRIVTKRSTKPQVIATRKSRTLDILSTSPKAAKRIKVAPNTRQVTNTTRTSPRINPLKAMSTAPSRPAKRVRATPVVQQSAKPVRRARSKKVTKRQVVVPTKRRSTLDVLSSSPKAAKRVKEAQKEQWKNRPKRKAPRVNPLKAVRA